jgi:hypothetical protein
MDRLCSCEIVSARARKSFAHRCPSEFAISRQAGSYGLREGSCQWHGSHPLGLVSDDANPGRVRLRRAATTGGPGTGCATGRSP